MLGNIANNSNICRYNISNSPLSPYMSLELLQLHHMFVDGSAIEETGFEYKFPIVTEQLLYEQVAHAVEARIFPPVSVYDSENRNRK